MIINVEVIGVNTIIIGELFRWFKPRKMFRWFYILITIVHPEKYVKEN